MLDNNLKQQLKSYLANLQHPVHLQLNLDDSNKAAELSALADDIASISANISVEQQQSTDRRAPLLELSSAEHNGIAFAGVPMGHEFTSLILALLQTGGHPVKADEALQQQIRNLPGEYNFEVYVSLSDGTQLDAVRYTSGVAPTGASLGVDPDCLSAVRNDNANCWCAQGGAMNSGDEGNPGEMNRGC